ncbi:DUF3888 domain-containing protein [Paenibacillus sp. GCM10012306]|uniref:DUF3888 domain-containing protein n=1 Tax=Paenibacillus sp. GCM10012306 TaxID=3317342 RepID=UPI003615A091
MLQKRWVTVLLVFFLTAFIPTDVLASGSINRPQESAQLPCDVVKDAFVSTLFKPIGAVLAQYNDERQFVVDQVVEVKRLEQGQYYWEATLKVTTFEGAHNPPYHSYIITFTNLYSDQPKVVSVQREP